MGLLWRLVLGVSAGILLGALCVFYLQATYDARSEQQYIVDEMEEASVLLLPMLSRLTLIHDYSTLHGILDTQVKFRRRVYRMEWGFNNGISILATSPIPERKAPAWFTQLIALPEPIGIERTPMLNGEFATLGIFVSPIPSENALWERFISLIRSVLLVIVAIVIAIFLILRINLRVLGLLSSASNRLRRGDYSARVNVQGAPELRSAAKAFNRMASRVQSLLDSLSIHKQELNEQLLFSNRLLESIPNPTYYLDSHGRFLGVNQAWETFFGIRRELCTNKTLDELPGVDRTFIAAQNRAKSILSKTRPSRVYEISIRNIENETIHIFVLNNRLENAQGEYAGLIVTIVDISALRLAESQTAEAVADKDRAVSASETKSRFLANMSHEMRTPLTAILGFAESLLDSDRSESERAESVFTIIRTAKHLAQLINDLLDLSKVEAGKMDVEFSPVDIFEVLTDVKNLAKVQLEAKDIYFRLEPQFPLPRAILSDPLRIRQILINLMSNAIKFTNEGGVRLGVSCTDGKNVIFSVIDSGIGITEEQAAKLFSPFEQADTSTTRKYGGTGLGLYLSRKLSGLLQGELEMQSKPGKGSCFSLSLPIGISPPDLLDAKPEEVHSVQQPKMEQILSGEVLLAEDNRDNQRLFAYQLSRYGVSPTIASNGKEAVDLITEHHYALVFMDMQMPVLDGLSAVKILRDRGNNTPIFALTANTNVEDRRRSSEAGCDGFLAKPIDQVELYRVLSQYLTSTGHKGVPIKAEILESSPEFIDIVNEFVSTLPAFIDSIEDAYVNGDIVKLKAKLHELKGVGANIGYEILVVLTKKIEGLINTDDLKGIAYQIDELKQVCSQIQAGLVEENSGSG